MASTLNKIGQSLLKYFKPVRTTPVHRAPKEFTVLVQKRTDSDSANSRSFSEDQEKLKKEFQPFRKNKAEHAEVEDTAEPVLSLEKVSQKLGAEHPLSPPPKAVGNWVELVIYLVGACRKVAEKLRQKGGMQFYKHTIDQQAARKIRTLGAIVDTTSDVQVKDKDRIDDAA